MRNHPVIIRRPALLNYLQISRSNLYAKISKGLWPKPILLGVRSVGWLESENEQVLAAMIAGESTNDIKQLVSSLMKERKTIGRKMAGEV